MPKSEKGIICCLNLLNKDLIKKQEETKQDFLAVAVQTSIVKAEWLWGVVVSRKGTSLLRSDSLLPHTAVNKHCAALAP